MRGDDVSVKSAAARGACGSRRLDEANGADGGGWLGCKPDPLVGEGCVGSVPVGAGKCAEATERGLGAGVSCVAHDSIGSGGSGGSAASTRGSGDTEFGSTARSGVAAAFGSADFSFGVSVDRQTTPSSVACDAGASALCFFPFFEFFFRG